MIVRVINECGYEESLLGLSLSFYDHAEQLESWWNEEKKTRAKKRAESLAFKGGGHNKYLESIQVWIYVQAPRAWWSEMDTYRVGISKNSSSTMHTLDKREVVMEDFEDGTTAYSMDAFNLALNDYKNPESEYYKDISSLKFNLPDGWLQERLISCNYMVLQNIIRQRTNHRLRQWDIFIDSLLSQLEHTELLVKI